MKLDLLQIDPAVDVVSTKEGHILFRTPQGDIPVTDPFGLVRRVTDQCRQGVTPEALESACNGDIECEQMRALVGKLSQRRLLKQDPPHPSGDVVTDWMRYYAGGKAAPLPSVSLLGSGKVADAVRDRLALAGFGFDASAESTGWIATCDEPDMDWLLEQNLQALAAAKPFMPIWVDRACCHWGPMVLPGATGCLECWWHRRQAASRQAQFAAANTAHPLSVSRIVADIAASLASADILRWALNAHVETDHGLAWCFDYLSSDLSGASVLRLPRCDACGR
jgi:hypothetical protein